MKKYHQSIFPYMNIYTGCTLFLDQTSSSLSSLFDPPAFIEYPIIKSID